MNTVTLDQINDTIAHEFYCRGDDIPRIAAELHVEVWNNLSLLTVCALVLKNGFTVVGTSACVDPANFDEQKGREIARQNAIQQLWPILGYQLREKLHGG